MSLWPLVLPRSRVPALFPLLLAFAAPLWPAAQARNTTCGGFLTQFRGSFQSPNHPNHYDDSAVCRWYIFAPKEFAILIEKHTIDIEDDAGRSDCPYDYLRYSFGNWKKTFCGRGVVEPILLDTNFVTVVLKTDASMSGTGFNISYRFVLPPCVRTFTASEGLLEIPEDKAKRNALVRRRRWCFHSARGNSYQFTFDYFDLIGEHSKCRHMYIKVLEKSEGQMRSHPRLCGRSIPEPVHTRSSSVSLLFLSDRPLDKNGLHLSWTVFGCNEEHRTAVGKLRFPREGVHTAFPATCRWTVYANHDQTVELTVTRLNLQRCDVEYLRIFEGEEEGRALLDDLCRLDMPVVITSTRRVMSLQLRLHANRRDAVEAAYQFRATLCEMMVIANRTGGVSHSYGFPKLYEHESECTWNVYAPKGERLAVFVTELRFSKSKYCTTSSLTVTDGTQPTSPVVAVLSRPEPRAFLSSEDALSLRICGGVVKFAYMSVPIETCSKAESPATEVAHRETAKSKADTSVVWEEIDQTPS
ncbi:cubilin-like isoform X4 [Haemaphysalis longicornis]